MCVFSATQRDLALPPSPGFIENGQRATHALVLKGIWRLRCGDGDVPLLGQSQELLLQPCLLS